LASHRLAPEFWEEHNYGIGKSSACAPC
jgi:hypothetical protein